MRVPRHSVRVSSIQQSMPVPVPAWPLTVTVFDDDVAVLVVVIVAMAAAEKGEESEDGGEEQYIHKEGSLRVRPHSCTSGPALHPARTPYRQPRRRIGSS